MRLAGPDVHNKDYSLTEYNSRHGKKSFDAVKGLFSK